MSFVMTDEFSVRVTKITSRIGAQSPLHLFCSGGLKIFQCWQKGGLALFEFLGRGGGWGGIVSKKQGVDFFKGGAADNFLKVIFDS